MHEGRKEGRKGLECIASPGFVKIVCYHTSSTGTLIPFLLILNADISVSLTAKGAQTSIPGSSIHASTRTELDVDVTFRGPMNCGYMIRSDTRKRIIPKEASKLAAHSVVIQGLRYD